MNQKWNDWLVDWAESLFMSMFFFFMAALAFAGSFAALYALFTWLGVAGGCT